MAARSKQLSYSEQMELMLDEDHRRQKAGKIASVLLHFLGRRDLRRLRVVDVGCSAGFIADEMRARGASVWGLDIDVAGLAKAQQRFGSAVGFTCADGEALPFPDESIDVVVFNHIYEHVVDPDAVLSEIRRVLTPDGVVYLGLGNRLGVMEPHYRLPFLSWLPRSVAHRYIRLAGRAEHYHEQFRTRPGLRRLVAGLNVWDYTYAVIADPVAFNATDMVRGLKAKVPPGAYRLARPVIPTFVWVGTKSDREPLGPRPRIAPRSLSPGGSLPRPRAG